MKLNSNIRNVIIEATCLLYIFLLVYAAMNKGIDFEKFQVELGQSPLLSAFANWISWTVLVVEFAIVIFLLFPKTRIKALHAGFCLMCMFTSYIFIMLNYSSYLPCSCGGILEKMSWQQHLLFNIFFVLLGGVSLWLHNNHIKTNNGRSKYYAIGLLSSFAVSSAIVIILFLSSEEIMHNQNPFIRRYPHHPVTLKHTVDLKYNSYYFAGAGDGKIYLGNSTVPLYLLSIDDQLKQNEIRATIDQKIFSFKSIRMAVQPPFFYILDGRVPVIYRGNIADWRAKLQNPRPSYFTIAVPMNSNKIVFRGISKSNSNNILGTFSYGLNSKTIMAPELLQKQIDGVFDTDGMLHYSITLNKIVYLYNYRNEFIVADENGNLDYRGNTIDTISKAHIKMVYLKNKTERTMAAPALSVNAHSSVYRHLLFVDSNVPGRYEQMKVWKQASVIDVYDLNKKRYLFSFHIYKINNKKLRNFIVTATHIYALIDSKLVVYQLNDKLKNEIKNASKNSL